MADAAEAAPAVEETATAEDDAAAAAAEYCISLLYRCRL